MNIQKRKKARKVLLYLTLAIIAFCSLFPLLFCLSASLRTQQDLSANLFPFSFKSLIPSEFTFSNYKTIFTDYHFIKPILNTVIVTGASIIGGCLLSSIAAFAYSCFEFKGRKLFYLLIMFSFMIPFESIAIPLYGIASKLKLIDTFAGMVLPVIADGMVIFLFIQFFKDIPTSLIEAARVDGASWPKIFFSIVMPISMPVFITASLMIFMNQWNAYIWPLLVARSDAVRTVQIAISAFSGERTIQWTLIYAATVISVLIPVIVFIPLQKYYVEGITSGSVKG